jgi:mannose-6-phosphate isomerase
MASGRNFPETALAPFLLEPRLVDKVWGYRDLRPWYDCVAGDANGSDDSKSRQPIGEVWLTGDGCKVVSGPHSGKAFAQVFRDAPLAMLGAVAPSFESPLLIKVIFAQDKLSVQVHPDDRMAQKYGEPRGKTECWYVLAADPGAQVAVGLKPGVTMEEVRAGIEQGTLEQILGVVPISRGDMVFVDAGTVHAIWPGSILLETQQNSDITYRMYDYGRPRPLHIEKSLEATRLKTRAGIVPPRALEDRTILIDVEYFRVERVPVAGSRSSTTLPGPGEAPGGLSYLFAVAGAARLAGEGFDSIELAARCVAAIPAASPAFTIEDRGGLDLIRVSPRWPEKAA